MTHPTSSGQPSDASALLRPRRGLLITLGLLTLLGGTAALFWPVLASVAVTAVVGAALMVQGAVQFWDALNVPGWRPRLWHFVTGLIALIGGALLVWNPLEGVLTLTALLIVMILLGGGARVALAMAARPQKGWGWVMLSGLISLGFGLWLMNAYFTSPADLAQAAGEEGAATRILGLFSLLGLAVGISMIFEGWSYLFLALALPQDLEEIDPDEAFEPPLIPPAPPVAPQGALRAPAPPPAPLAAVPRPSAPPPAAEPPDAQPSPVQPAAAPSPAAASRPEAQAAPPSPDPVKPTAAPAAAPPEARTVAAEAPPRPFVPPKNRPARPPGSFSAPSSPIRTPVAPPAAASPPLAEED
ncbi:HdeD family acid-resistance protein [Neomegalonema sp.]|uniref:HdeD family acid-resistance protein n=1 Tax=Neomegalonema sp. TaxID=2039713 RepID=UPI00261198E6|nr:DUF308 domain-containing protein [Neomegalonema sp.]MDD2869857.1 DUF308 domain-containing protein [Neomegalonema sp.]